MERLIASFVAFVCLSLPAAAASWKKGMAPNSIISCNPTSDAESFFCLLLKCDGPGNLGLYIQEGESRLSEGKTPFKIDAEPMNFQLTAAFSPYTSYKVSNVNDALIQKLKGARSVSLDMREMKAERVWIPMTGASAAITSLEEKCRSGAASGARNENVGGSCSARVAKAKAVQEQLEASTARRYQVWLNMDTGRHDAWHCDGAREYLSAAGQITSLVKNCDKAQDAKVLADYAQKKHDVGMKISSETCR